MNCPGDDRCWLREHKGYATCDQSGTCFHHDQGGPMSLNRRNPRRDENEPLLIDYLRKAGAVVQRLSGPDVPDLLVGYRGTWLLLEVKMPGADLKPGQELFHNTCQALGLPCDVIRSVEDCQRILKRTRRVH